MSFKELKHKFVIVEELEGLFATWELKDINISFPTSSMGQVAIFKNLGIHVQILKFQGSIYNFEKIERSNYKYWNGKGFESISFYFAFISLLFYYKKEKKREKKRNI